MRLKSRFVSALQIVAALALFTGPVFADADTSNMLKVLPPPKAPKYIPVTGIYVCGVGRCRTSLDPVQVLPLSGLGLALATLNLAIDLGAQRPGYQIVIGPSLNATLTIANYFAFNNGEIGRGQLVFDMAAAKGAALPANLHWVQVVTDNDNFTGINGADLMAAKGPGKPENVIDAPFDPSPYYDVTTSSKNNPKPFNSAPPLFGDRSSRPDPTAAVPTITWTADLFLVSDPGTKTMTIYDAVKWGWVSQYSANGMFAPVPEPESWGVMLVGAGLVGVISRRRRQAPRTV